MQRTSLLSLLAIAMLLIASCKSSDKSAIAIPKDAGFVFQINTASLSSKLSWKEIQQTNWFKTAYAKSEDSLAKKLLDNPENTGINTDADLVFFAKNQGGIMFTVFEGLLKDAAAFEALNKKIQENAKATKNGDINVLQGSKEGITTWNNNKFIYVFQTPAGGGYNFSGDGEGGPRRVSTDSLIAFAKELYELKSSENLSSDDRYAALVKETGDMHMWINAENLTGDLLGDVFAATKISDLIKGNVSAFTLNFDKGKIDGKSTSYYNKEMTALMEKYPTKDIEAELLSRLPSENITGVFSWNYPPAGLKEFLRIGGLEGLVNGFLGKAGYSLDEFVKANKGDVLVAASDFELKAEQVTIPSYEEGGQPYTYTKTDPKVNVLFAASVNDKPAFEKLISVVKAQVGDFKADSVFHISYSVNDKWFAAGNSVDQVNKFLAGDAKNKHAAIGKLAGHPSGFYVDIKKILTASTAATTDSTAKIALTESLNMWEDVLATGDHYSGGKLTGHFEINLVNKNENSLKQLNQYFDKLATLEMNKKGF
ncbi:DUF4836 family protein [Paraflavitalea sp. CAU 1676]|uniref:DUF4836 family protein n=1 Tax=Paraflavitalea sp. CAU 1676 TaxID=3032598 RepID=UPI0023DB286A|nr:DUF4836 family protein [Paraflavitalea sp. CAU 1676]MDF2192995.1 DUF4836 family protein [Paraflavitalea sp. CAU 1676]